MHFLQKHCAMIIQKQIVQTPRKSVLNYNEKIRNVYN